MSTIPPPPAERIKGLGLVLGFLFRRPWRTGLAVGLVLVIIAIEMLMPVLVGRGVDGIAKASGAQEPFNPVAWAAVLFGLVLTRELLRFGTGRLRGRLVQDTLLDIRRAIYDKLQRASFSYQDRMSAGDLISRATNDVSRMQEFYFVCLYLVVDIVVSFGVSLTLIALTHSMLGIVALGTALPTVVLVLILSRELHPKWRRVHDLSAELASVVQENVAGVRVVRAFGREEGEIDRFNAKKEALVREVVGAVRYWASRVPMAQFVFGLSVPLTLWIGGGLVNGAELTIGELVRTIFLLMALGWRMGSIGNLMNTLQSASAASARVAEVLGEPEILKSGTLPLPEGSGAIRFESVGKAYDGRMAALQNVTFEVAPGETIAIVGPTGSGKSTLVSLIPRFHDADSGAVYLDGVNVRDLDLAALRRAVGVVFQETFLFEATVFENIAYGAPNASAERVQACARAAQAEEFILRLPEGYETRLGERGISLSGGQRQRLAIARALLVDPRILILDDATAAVDARTEKLINAAVGDASAGRTTMIIAQRPTSVRRAARILVLDKGGVADFGTHDQLIERNAFYKQFMGGPTPAEPGFNGRFAAEPGRDTLFRNVLTHDRHCPPLLGASSRVGNTR